MLFNTNLFLYTFLPLFLVAYLPCAKLFNIRLINNLIIVLASSFFYYWGSGTFVLIFVGSIAGNYFIGYYLYEGKCEAFRKIVVVSGVIANLALLAYFKYANFFYAQIALALHHFNVQLPALDTIFLPIGISFYTFMAISYLIETYRRVLRATDIIDFSCYMTMFPHLVAGPIVRYSEISSELSHRTVSLDDFSEGMWRFAVGMVKKVIFAATFATATDKIYNLSLAERPPLIAWLGVLTYTLQIYFDFSGYSDMAVGLARMMGFHFPENFNEPYRAASITEFWKRWHMTLSRWFRDFLYIPLGGNRRGVGRTYFNLYLVFLLCGLWHGASWHFVVWGLFHGTLLVVERLTEGKLKISLPPVVAVLRTFLLVGLGWVLFRAPTLDSALDYYRSLLGLGMHHDQHQYYRLAYFLDWRGQIICGLALLWVFKPNIPAGTLQPSLALKSSIALIALMLTAIQLSKSTFQPFIYFQF